MLAADGVAGMETKSLLTFTVCGPFAGSAAAGAADFFSSFAPVSLAGSSFSASAFPWPDKYFWRTGRPGIFGREEEPESPASDAPPLLGLSEGAEG